ncbi:hypothetical protein CAEBREN_03504 [Caenorhabditis brenneri]|uniref:RING-type domain-containing protein n=1 Tax=Caenorhabditis brenneri TaxID=135651 RepID=G0MWU1_CAEBE|nr:hypothetical protein CAEBREN_03504 [Caenorhabditis brenneri]
MFGAQEYNLSICLMKWPRNQSNQDELFMRLMPCCNICSFPYTETGIHTPRIIITCGHTICEQCANNLLNVKLESVLVCPFCQKPTVVDGPAGILPKNFALLEQIY